MSDYICLDCGEPCEIVEETFDYPGTHCTHGLGGTHHTGHYYSACCSADYEPRGYMLHSQDYDADGEPRIYQEQDA